MKLVLLDQDGGIYIDRSDAVLPVTVFTDLFEAVCHILDEGKW